MNRGGAKKSMRYTQKKKKINAGFETCTELRRLWRLWGRKGGFGREKRKEKIQSKISRGERERKKSEKEE